VVADLAGAAPQRLIRDEPALTGSYISGSFLGIVIAMFFDDHGPPHFHARHADGRAKIRLDTLEPIETTLGRRQLPLVLASAQAVGERQAQNAANSTTRSHAGPSLRRPARLTVSLR
jgi:Domain of unknown function (DUF4160)